MNMVLDCALGFVNEISIPVGKILSAPFKEWDCIRGMGCFAVLAHLLMCAVSYACFFASVGLSLLSGWMFGEAVVEFGLLVTLKYSYVFFTVFLFGLIVSLGTFDYDD